MNAGFLNHQQDGGNFLYPKPVISDCSLPKDGVEASGSTLVRRLDMPWLHHPSFCDVKVDVNKGGTPLKLLWLVVCF